MFESAVVKMIGNGILETLYMTLTSTFIAYVIGLPLGVALVVTDKDGIHPVRWLNCVLNVVVKILRSIRFDTHDLRHALTRAIIGTTRPDGDHRAARHRLGALYCELVESSIKEIDRASSKRPVHGRHAHADYLEGVLPEAGHPRRRAIAVTTILSYSAMAGIIGGRGSATSPSATATTATTTALCS